MTPEQIIASGGTAGTILLLAYIARLLWEAHKEHDADVRKQRDDALADHRVSDQTAKKAAAALETIARERASRRRQGERS